MVLPAFTPWHSCTVYSRQTCSFACLLQHASVSHGRGICSDNLTCCHTEIEVADPTFHLIQSQYTDTGRTSPSAYPITPGAWQGRHWSANFLSHWYDSTCKKSRYKRDSNPVSSALEADALTTRPMRRFKCGRPRFISRPRHKTELRNRCICDVCHWCTQLKPFWPRLPCIPQLCTLCCLEETTPSYFTVILSFEPKQ